MAGGVRTGRGAFQQYLPLSGGQQPGKDAEQAGFPRAIGASQQQRTTCGHRKTQPGENRPITADAGKLAYLQNGLPRSQNPPPANGPHPVSML